MKIYLLQHDMPSLRREFELVNQPAYRANQLADWVYKKGVFDTTGMTNVPAVIRDSVTIMDTRVVERLDSKDGTIKLLVELSDGHAVETVFIPSPKSVAACVSSQAGCAMGCRFCASAIGGFKRNLRSDEIIQQVLHLWRESGTKPTHVVFMGTGEPLMNLEQCVAAVRSLIDPDRFNISARHVTVSTAGLPDGIRQLAATHLPITLAISLHAPNDALRKKIMPLANKHSLDDVLAAAEAFYESRHREITLEYLLLAGFNDTNVCAEGLARIANRLRCNVNVIVYNPVDHLEFTSPSPAQAAEFVKRLRSRGVNAHLRASRGGDTQAACGQLRLRSGAAQ
jgi:23S rRNA (adenine2503-C2)-methyltransferase